MSAFRVVVGIILIALLAYGIVYLEQHGYFQRASVDERGLIREENPQAPAPEPKVTNTPNPQPAPVPTPSADADAEYAKTQQDAQQTYTQERQAESEGKLPVGTARADYESTMRKAQADRDLGRRLQAQTPTPNPNPQAVPNTTSRNNPATTAQGNFPGVPESPMQAPWPKGAVADVNGNPCMPIKPRPVRAASPHQESVPRRHTHVVTHTYTTTYVSNEATGPTLCPLMRETSDGTHIVTLPAGMLINATVDRDLSTAASISGDTFSAYLVGPVTYCGRVVIPAGAQVQGTVALAHNRGTFSEANSTLELRLNSMQANGADLPIRAGSITTQNRDDLPLRSVTMDSGGREYTSVVRTGREIEFPANSVVSFWLQSPTQVFF